MLYLQSEKEYIACFLFTFHSTHDDNEDNLIRHTTQKRMVKVVYHKVFRLYVYATRCTLILTQHGAPRKSSGKKIYIKKKVGKKQEQKERINMILCYVVAVAFLSIQFAMLENSNHPALAPSYNQITFYVQDPETYDKQPMKMGNYRRHRLTI